MKMKKAIIYFFALLFLAVSSIEAKKNVRKVSRKKTYKSIKKKRVKRKTKANVVRVNQNELLNCKQFLHNKINNGEYSVGIDISRYQKINFNELDTSIKFVICKASEGTRLIDRKFAYHWNNISDRMKKGAYHFFIPHVSGKQQARLFLSVVPFEKGHLLPVIDVEQCWAYKRAGKVQKVQNLKEFIKEIEMVLGVKPIIYTNSHFWNTNFAPYMKDMTNDFQLWIADYRGSDEPGIPRGWSDWSIWQHSPKGRLSGIASDVDLNVCKVNINKLLIK
jgi:lysozyme